MSIGMGITEQQSTGLALAKSPGGEDRLVSDSSVGLTKQSLRRSAVRKFVEEAFAAPTDRGTLGEM